MANGFLGKENGALLSTANQELIVPPAGWNVKPVFYKISFYNKTPCHIKINGNQIYLREEQGFESDTNDALIYSFVIVESGIDYNFVGAY
jgi:hypothetical protein